MKRILKPLLQLVSLFLVLISLILFVSQVLCFQCSSDEARIKLFRNESQNSLEVVLFGSSAVRADFIPTKAYENHGIRCFDYSINHMPLPATMYMIQEVLQTQNPELIVIDINGITYCNEEITTNKSVALLELMQEGEIKDAALKELTTKDSWENNIPFIKYHSNIWNLSRCLKYSSYYEKFGDNKTILKGYTTNPAGLLKYEDDEILDHTKIPDDVDFEFNDYEKNAVSTLLDYCDTIKNTTQILFVRFPRLTIRNYNESELKYINEMERYVVNRGYDFVDLSDYIQDIGLQTQEDFVDETHLNHFGAEKFTDYFSKYILFNYDITRNYGLSDWDKCVEYANKYYELIKEGTLKENHKEYFELDLAREFGVFGI